jgi:flagellar biosynthesis anti-sigma factor FlgM
MNVRSETLDVSQIFPAQPPGAAAALKNPGTPPEGTLPLDTAQLSATATQAAQTVSISDVRLDKVASIQKALQTGTYDVPTEDVAKRIIGTMLSTDE